MTILMRLIRRVFGHTILLLLTPMIIKQFNSCDTALEKVMYLSLITKIISEET